MAELWSLPFTAVFAVFAVFIVFAVFAVFVVFVVFAVFAVFVVFMAGAIFVVLVTLGRALRRGAGVGSPSSVSCFEVLDMVV